MQQFFYTTCVLIAMTLANLQSDAIVGVYAKSQPGGTIYLKLLKYINAQNLLNDHKKCDSGKSPCDTYFIIRLGTQGSKLLETTTQVWRNQDTIEFGSKLSDTVQNPILTPLTNIPETVTLDILAHDETIDGMNPKITDFYREGISLKQSFRWDEKFDSSNVDKINMLTLFGNPSSIDMTVDIWVKCNENYFGKKCSTYCESNSNTICDDQGTLKCKDTALTPPCTSQAKPSIIIIISLIVVLVFIFGITITLVARKFCAKRSVQKRGAKSALSTSTSITYDGSVRIDRSDYEQHEDGRIQSFFNGDTYEPLSFTQPNEIDEYEIPRDAMHRNDRPLPLTPPTAVENYPDSMNFTTTPLQQTASPGSVMPSYSFLSKSYTKPRQ